MKIFKLTFLIAFWLTFENKASLISLKANEATFHPENLQTMSKKELKEQLEKDLYMRLQIMQLVDVVKTDIEVIEEHVDEMEMELQKHKATHGHGH